MTKVMIFDADGVVVRNPTIFSQYLDRDFGITVDTTRGFFESEFGECLVGRADLKTELEKYIGKWGWEKSIGELLDYWFSIEDNVDRELIKFIKRTREEGTVCYLATNQEKYRTKYLRTAMGFDQYFDGVYSSCDIGYLKNRPEFWQYVLKELGDIRPKEILFFDDSPENIEAAQGVGIRAELYTDFDSFRDTIS